MNRPFELAAAMLLIAATTFAQNETRATLRDPALDALVTEALAGAPETASARATAEAAALRVAPAGSLPDPFLSTSYQNDGRGISLGDEGGSFLGVMLSQSIPGPGKLALSSQAMKSEAREIETSVVGRATLTIEARVRTAWYELALARAIDRILDARRNTAVEIEASVRERYAAGLAVQQDVLRAQVEIARIDELKAAQAATIFARTAELNRLLGRRHDDAIAISDPPPIEPLPAAEALIDSVVARSPELAAAQQGIETGRIRVEIAKKNFLPDLVVNGGSMYRAGYDMGPMWQLGVGMSIPIWTDRKQRNQLAEAQANAKARTADAEAIRRELELRTRERIAQLEATQRVAMLYRDQIVKLDELSLESALASYQAGKVPFITVLDAVNSLYNDRAAYASRLAESAKWRVAIDEASLEPATPMSAGAPMGSSGTSIQKSNNRNEPAGGAMPSMR